MDPCSLGFDADGNCIEEPVFLEEDFPESEAFMTWLREQTGRDCKIGDLASDVNADLETTTYLQLYRRVRLHCGARRALEAARRQYAVRVFT